MKKVALVAIAVGIMLTASICFASPLSDYSAGKTAIDLTWRYSDLKGSADGVDGWNLGFGHKSNFDGGITTGLGNKFAIQYNIYNADSKDVIYQDEAGHGKLDTQQFNVLYKLDSNISAYTGVMSTKFSSVTDTGTFNTSTSNKWQIGLVGDTKIGDKTTAYASVGVGKDLATWQLGVSQEIAPSLEFNVDYRYIDAKKITGNDFTDNVDATVKGLGMGVTYKF